MNPNTFNLSDHNKIRSAAQHLAGRRWNNVLTCYNRALAPNRKRLEPAGILISTPALPGTIPPLLCQFLGNGRCDDRNRGLRRGSFWGLYRNPRSLPAKSRHTMHGDAAARFLSELGVEQLEPVVNNLSGRGAAIVERPVLRQEANIKPLMSRDQPKDGQASTRTRTWIPSFSTGALSYVASQTLTSVLT